MSVQVHDKSKQAYAQISSRVKDALQKDFVEVMVDVAKQECPVVTDTLRKSIDSEPRGSDGYAVFTRTGYGAYVELGTSRMAARPFMQKGFQAADREFRNSSQWRR